METRSTFTSITVNGQTYSNIDEMPPDVRRQYEQAMSLLADRNNDGIPDAFEGATASKDGTATIQTVVHEKVIHSGDIPPGLASKLLSGPASSSRLTHNHNPHLTTGITLSLPTLITLLTAAALITVGVMWYTR